MITYVEVHFHTPSNQWDFTDADYQFFGDGDIERGKRNVARTLDRLADLIDAELYAGTNKALGGIGG